MNNNSEKIKKVLERRQQEVVADMKLNSLYAATFNSPAGQQVLEHLENEISSVMPLGSSELEIIHREGGRFILKSIINRTEKGRNND